MSVEHLQKAIEVAGGQSALARKLSSLGKQVSQPRVYKWLHSPNPELMPPAEFCPSIERVTGVLCEELRPDVDWAYIRNPPCRCEQLP